MLVDLQRKIAIKSEVQMEIDGRMHKKLHVRMDGSLSR